MAEEVSIHIVLPFFVGVIIGIIEAYFVYEDENMTSGRQFFGDMWHGLLFSIFGVLIASNVSWLLSQGWFPEWMLRFLLTDESGNSLVVAILVTLFMMIKMVTSHAVKGISGRGFKEKLWHKLVVAIAVGFSSYYLSPLYASGFMQGLAQAIPWLPF